MAIIFPIEKVGKESNKKKRRKKVKNKKMPSLEEGQMICGARGDTKRKRSMKDMCYYVPMILQS